MSRGTAIYCTRGHYLGFSPNREGKPDPKFCGDCGSDAVKGCPHCNAGLEIQSSPNKFCKQCGKTLPWAK